MIEAYESGDAYLGFAKQAGAVPATATKATHGPDRELYKACALAVQYGMGEESLAARIGKPVSHARELLKQHHEIYRRFWRWSDAAVDHAMMHGSLSTTFGWKMCVQPAANPRSLRNFPMQANGAEMLRLGCCLALERGVKVCAPIHDAILIEAAISDLDDAIATTQQVMKEVSQAVLDGFALCSEVKIIRYPDRYEDERGQGMWQTVRRALTEVIGSEYRGLGTSTCSPEGYT
jgi:DNA polymerase I-like protein with 3'-5' exonuclease and polymerase domains